MMRIAVRFALLLAIGMSSANASGLSLNWDGCAADGRVANKTSACTANVGSAGIMVATFNVSEDLLSVGGLEVFVDLVSGGTVLPAWWTKSCRTPFSLNSVIEPTALQCRDWSSGRASGGLAAYGSCSNSPSAAGILAGFVIVPAGSVDVLALPPDGSEYFAFNIVLSNAKSSGTGGAGSCAGCDTPVILSFNALRIFSGATTVAITGAPQSPASNVVSWQGGAGIYWPPTSGCQFTPTHKSTWGSVKALYR